MVKCMNKGCGANGRECCQGDKDGVTCYGYMPPKTNADRIRSMTDEELAEYLAWLVDKQTCSPEWLIWLKEEK